MTADHVRDALDIVERIHVEGEPVTPNDLGFDDYTDEQDAIDLWRRAKRQEAAAKLVAQAAGAQLASLLGEGGAARIGDRVVRYARKRTERCIDPDGAAAYITQKLSDGDVEFSEVVNPQYAKRAWMDDAARSTFYDWEDGDEALSDVALDRAPKFLQALEDGEVKKRG